jgi:DNA-directed RNA polymerase specialized sigma24 family protein
VSSEQAEFAEFFRASWKPCLRAVIAVAGRSELAEDQVAEAFTRAWASWRKVRRHPAPQAWVVRTALNTGASWWRKRSRELPLANHDLTTPDGLGGGLDAALLTALGRLPARQREVIALRIFLDRYGSSLTWTRTRSPGSWESRLGRSGRTCPGAWRRCGANSP